MSEELKIPTLQDMASVTTDDVMSFMDEKIQHSNCPACDAKDWAFIHDTRQVLALTAMPADGSYALPPQSIPIVAAACVNCGYVRVHVLGVILKWKTERDGVLSE